MRKPRPTIKSLTARVAQLERLCAEVYQVAGVVGAPVQVLDTLSAAADGRPIPRRSLLPIEPCEFDPVVPLGSKTRRLRIVSAEALPEYRLRLGLSDGRTIERDVSDVASAPKGPMTEPFADPAFFAQVRFDPELETVVWPNGYDMDPDVLIFGVDGQGNLMMPDEEKAARAGLTCQACHATQMVAGTVTKTLERRATLVVVRHVPALVCERCGSPLFTADTTDRLIEAVNDAERNGIAFQVRHYQPSPQ